jgi:hypothetical protein
MGHYPTLFIGGKNDMNKIVNLISYNELEPEIRLRLERYVGKIAKLTGERWKISHIYKPIRWYRARLGSPDGSEFVIWYRPNKRCWTVINSYHGLGIRRRLRRKRSLSDEEKQRMIFEALQRLKEST